MKRKMKLSTHFALLSAILVGIVVLLVSAYVIWFIRDLSEQIDIQTDIQNRSVATAFFQMLGDGTNPKTYAPARKVINGALTNNLIAYFFMKDNTTEMVEHSSIVGLKGKKFKSNLLDIYSANEIKIKGLLPNQPTYYVSGINKNKTTYIGFYKKSVLTQDLEILVNNMSYIIVFAMMIGLILSYLMVRTVSKPLNEVITGTKEFAQGNLSHRIREFKYEEIDELVNSYNLMAETLQELYTSLEQTVMERTQQLNKAYKDLLEAQSTIVHSEKMRSLGELVAGITHEINNPINFIYGNLIHLTNYTNDMINLIEKYEAYEPDLIEEHRREIQNIKKEIDIAFLKDDIRSLIESCREGTERTKNIVLDLKNFSRMEQMVLSSIDLAKEIDTTLNILNSKFKNRIEIHREYQKNMPTVEAYGGQLNQVFMNILDNAFYAIKEKGDVYIRVKTEDKNAIIEIEDNGLGMSRETVQSVFDPFFTTKPVGQGTGLGMSISYKVINSHNGQIKVESEVGKGTKFKIILPLEQKRTDSPAPIQIQ